MGFYDNLKKGITDLSNENIVIVEGIGMPPGTIMLQILIST